MAFFSPYDNVAIKMYISDETLDKYPNCTLSRMREWKKSGDTVVMHGDAILLFDINTIMLNLIIECMQCDFNISAIYMYIADGSKNIIKTGYYGTDNICGTHISLNTNVSRESQIFLTKFRKILHKYNFDDVFCIISSQNDKPIDYGDSYKKVKKCEYLAGYDDIRISIGDILATDGTIRYGMQLDPRNRVKYDDIQNMCKFALIMLFRKMHGEKNVCGENMYYTNNTDYYDIVIKYDEQFDAVKYFSDMIAIVTNDKNDNTMA